MHEEAVAVTALRLRQLQIVGMAAATLMVVHYQVPQE
jgi:hypothetical protein